MEEMQEAAPHFSSLPKVMKEEIFSFLTSVEKEKARVICKEWKNVVDEAKREEFLVVKIAREDYLRRKREEEEEGERNKRQQVYVGDDFQTGACCIGPGMLLTTVGVGITCYLPNASYYFQFLILNFPQIKTPSLNFGKVIRSKKTEGDEEVCSNCCRVLSVIYWPLMLPFGLVMVILGLMGEMTLESCVPVLQLT